MHVIWVVGLPVPCARGSQGDAEGKDSTPIPFIPFLSFPDTNTVQPTQHRQPGAQRHVL